MHRRFIYRQITSSLKQTYIFVACVALALVTLVSIGGFGESVNNALLRDARKLLAADVVIESHFPFEEKLEAELNQLFVTFGTIVSTTVFRDKETGMSRGYGKFQSCVWVCVIGIVCIAKTVFMCVRVCV